MIAERLRYETGQDDAMVELLRELARGSRLGRLSTERFVGVLTKRAPQVDWQQMIDQWVLRAEIPVWRAKTEIVDSDSGSVVRITARQDDVDETFAALVPVRITSANGETEDRWIEMAEPYVEVELPVDHEPRKVELNPDHAVLAKIRSYGGQ